MEAVATAACAQMEARLEAKMEARFARMGVGSTTSGAASTASGWAPGAPASAGWTPLSNADSSLATLLRPGNQVLSSVELKGYVDDWRDPEATAMLSAEVVRLTGQMRGGTQ